MWVIFWNPETLLQTWLNFVGTIKRNTKTKKDKTKRGLITESTYYSQNTQFGVDFWKRTTDYYFVIIFWLKGNKEINKNLNRSWIENSLSVLNFVSFNLENGELEVKFLKGFFPLLRHHICSLRIFFRGNKKVELEDTNSFMVFPITFIDIDGTTKLINLGWLDFGGAIEPSSSWFEQNCKHFVGRENLDISNFGPTEFIWVETRGSNLTGCFMAHKKLRAYKN